MSRNRDDDEEYVPSGEEASSEEVEGLVSESPSRGSAALVQQLGECCNPPQVALMPDLLQDFAGWSDLYYASILDGIKDRTPPRPDIIVEEQGRANHAAKALDNSRGPRRLETHWDHVLDEMFRVSKNFMIVRRWKLAEAKKFVDRATSGEKKALDNSSEPRRLETHWDHVLDEMLRVSKNFMIERRWKLADAKKFADQAISGEKKGSIMVVNDELEQAGAAQGLQPAMFADEAVQSEQAASPQDADKEVLSEQAAGPQGSSS